jgi:hypothetical protein
MGFKKRQMVFIPEVNAASFVFFFEKGDSGLSWSIYDYSAEEPPAKRFDRSRFPWTAHQVRSKAIHSFDAPTVGTNEYEYWHGHTLELNQTHLSQPAEPEEPPEPQDQSGDENVQRPEPGETIRQFLGRSSDVYTKMDLAQRASLHKRKIDGGNVSPSTITRICKGEIVGRLNREAVAAVISPVIPCTADDLLPSWARDGNTVKANEKE